MANFILKTEEAFYTVWVGGTEVNDFYVSKNKANKLAQKYINKGYDDVIIEKV